MLGGTAVEFDPAQARGTAFGKTNVIAEHAVVSGDLRDAVAASSSSSAKETMQAIVAASLPQTQATITFDEGYPPMAPTDGNARLLGDVRSGEPRPRVRAGDRRQPGHAPAPPTCRSSRARCKMILDGVGLMGHGDHTAGETADLSTLPSQTKRAAVTIYRLTQR